MSKKVRTLYKPRDFILELEKDSPNFRIPGYHIIEDKRRQYVNKSKEKKLTLKDVLNSISDFKVEVRESFKRVDKRIDNLEKGVNERLDYIVKANKLKDIPKKSSK